MPKLKNTLKNLANLDAPAAPQVAAAEIVKQVASQEKSRPAVPVQKGADKPSRENFDPFLEAGPATTGQVPEGPPPGYQYGPDEFAPQQNPIAAAVEQAASPQSPQVAAAIVQNIQAPPKAVEPVNGEQRLLALDHWISGASPQEAMDRVRSGAQAVQQVQSQNSPDGKRIVMASQSPNDWTLNDISPGPTRQRPQPRSPDEWALNDISPGPTPSQEWVLEPDLPPPAAAAQVVQGIQAGDSNQNYNAGAGGGGGAPPPGNRTEFSIPEPDDSGRSGGSRIAGEPLKSGLWNHLANGFLTQAGDKAYSDSVIGDAFRGRKFPEIENSGFADKAAFQTGRVAADIQGYGTRKGFWNMNPEDAVGTTFREIATNQGLTAPQSQLARYAAATTLGLVGGNYNPLNIAEGGRTEGFSAINPTEEDPRKSTNPIGEFAFDRAMLGRTGRVLPWEQFHEERPEVPYQTYADYQEYLRAPAFLGLVKGTMNGIDGPEARIVGSRVQPEAVLAALAAGAAVIGGFKYGSRKV